MKSIWNIVNHSRDVRLRVFGAVAATIGFKFLDMAPGFLIGAIIDLIVRQEHSFVASAINYDRSKLVSILILAIIGTWIFSALFQYLASRSWRAAAHYLQHDVRINLFRNVHCLPMSWFHQNDVGSTFETLNNDVNQVEIFVSRGLDEIVQVCISVSLLWFIVALIDIRLLWCVVFPVPALMVFVWYIRPKVKLVYQAERKRTGQLSSVLHRHLIGFLDIKSLAQENLSLKEITSVSLSIREDNRQSANFTSALTPMIKLIVICGIVAVLIYGGGMVIDGQLNAGIFTSVFFLTQRFLWPLNGIGRIVDNYSRTLTYLQHIDSIQNASKEDLSDGDERHFQIDAMRLDNISFSYSNKTLFSALSGEFLAGQITAIQGPSGVGKTTLSLCMLRLYNLSEGTIRLGGASIEDIPLGTLRRLIGYIPQNPQLFCGSLLENIALDDPNPDQRKIERLLESLGLAELIDKLSIPFDSNAHGTMKLSGGQIQRIAIARVLYRDARVMIFDEATSGLDAERETQFLSLLNQIKDGRVIIFISHRESIRLYADRVYQLNDRRLIKVIPDENRKTLPQRLAIRPSIQAGLSL